MYYYRVKSQRFEYDVLLGQEAWRALRRFPCASYSSVFVVTEPGVWKRWGKLFREESRLKSLRPLFVPSGEGSKSLKMVERLSSQLLRSGADRQSLLVALGGGVIGDLGGFLASTYMRGIHYIQAPTTIVAQVDSAIGGKTAVNTRGMKNLIGTFYPPRLVVANPAVLVSMGERAFRSGLYEVVKHAILTGPPFFTQLDAVLELLRAADLETLEPILAKAVEVKVDIVNHDEREASLRQVLNLGHTFGHAFEEVTHYRRFLHGEAVGWGLLTITRLGRRLGLLAASEAERIDSMVRRVGPLPSIQDLNPGRVLPLLAQDKKAVRGTIHWVVPERVGKVRITAEVSLKAAAAALRDVQKNG